MAAAATIKVRIDGEGRLTLPEGVRDSLGLEPGTEVAVVVGRFPDAEHEHWRQVAEFEFPDDFQARLRDLLDRNREGKLEEGDQETLDVMIQQVEWQTAQRARARLELSRLKYVQPPAPVTGEGN